MSSYDFEEWACETPDTHHKMSTNSGTKSTIDSAGQAQIRAVVVKGILAFLDTTRHGLLRWFNGFHDLEVAVNKENLISDNCAALADHEMALLIRMTEVFDTTTQATQKTPRSLMFGVVLMKTMNGAFDVRLWEVLKPAWKEVGVDDTTPNTQSCIDNITSELMEAMWNACKEMSPKIEVLSIADHVGCDGEDTASAGGEGSGSD